MLVNLPETSSVRRAIPEEACEVRFGFEGRDARMSFNSERVTLRHPRTQRKLVQRRQLISSQLALLFKNNGDAAKGCLQGAKVGALVR